MISVQHLTKCYGNFMAVDDLSFEIEEGHVYGFLGPNGAGKSTTMNIMTGCLSATEGHVKIDGHDIFDEPDEAKKLIGYLPEQPPLYMNETPREYLKFVGEAKGLRGHELRVQIDRVISLTKLEDVQTRLISKLSKGYKQRVGIAQALLGNPKVIILDEPTVGLDPIQIIEIRDLIKQLGQTHTVIFSSHILSEVQAICEKILIINKGKLVAYDKTENLEKMMLGSNELQFVTEADEEEVAEILANVDGVAEWIVKNEAEDSTETERTVIAKLDCEDSRDVCRKLFFAFAGKQKAILEMSVKKFSLEEVFLELTENNPDAGDLETSKISGETMDLETAKISRETTDLEKEKNLEESEVDEA